MSISAAGRPAEATAEGLHFEVLEGRGMPLLLVHGILSDRHHWDSNLEALSKVCRPVVIELWGHGQSPSPKGPDAYAADAYVEQLEQVRKLLGSPARIMLCGQSFGASLTLRYSLNYPDVVAGQVFTNSMSAVTPGKDAIERAAMVKDLEERGRPAMEALPFHPRHARRMAPAVKESLLRAAAQVDPFALAMTLQYSAPTLYLGDRLTDIKTPTLLVNGVFEKAFQPFARVVAEKLPNGRVVAVQGGHAVNLEAAGEFNESVVRFIEELNAQHRELQRA